MIFELAQDFHDALATLPQEHPKHRMLELLEEAIRRDIHFIARHPTTLFQCMWNTCWWYDCPEAARHYKPPPEGWPDDGTPWFASGCKLHSLFEYWLTEKEIHTPGFFWIRSLRPPILLLAPGQCVVLRGHEGVVESVAFSPDGLLIASGSSDQTVRVWDVRKPRELQCFRGHSNSITSVDFSPDGREIVSGSVDKTIRLWSIEQGQPRLCIKGHQAWVTSVAFSPDGTKIASGSHDKTARIWNAKNGAELVCFSGHNEKVNSVAFSPDGKRIVSGSGNQADLTGSSTATVRIWNATTGEEETPCFNKHTHCVNSVTFLPDNRRVASASNDCTVRIWDPDRRDHDVCLRGYERWLASVAISSDGLKLATGASGMVSDETDTDVRIWDITHCQEIARLYGHDSNINSVAFSPDGERIISASKDMTIRHWNINKVRRTGILQGHNSSISGILIFGNGSRLLTWGYDYTLRIWDIMKGLEIFCLAGHEEPIYSVAISDDDKLIASGSGGLLFDKNPLAARNDPRVAGFGGAGALGIGEWSVRVWNAKTGAPIACCRGHKGNVNCIAFSPDAKLVASGSDDETVRIWNATRGTQYACLRGHNCKVKSIVFSSDGKQIKAIFDDATIRIWRVSNCIGRLVNQVWASMAILWTYIRPMRKDTGVTEGPGHEGVFDSHANPGPFPWRILARKLETAVISENSQKEMAWFPVPFNYIALSSAGRICVCSFTKDVFCLAMEEGLPEIMTVNIHGLNKKTISASGNINVRRMNGVLMRG